MTDEKLRLQKHPGYLIYSPVPASGVRAMTDVRRMSLLIGWREGGGVSVAGTLPRPP